MQIRNILPGFLGILFYYNVCLLAQGVSYNQEFQVNTNTEWYQKYPDVSGLSDGGFIVCWDGNHAQLFNNDGSLRGAEFRVNSDFVGNQQNTIVSGLNDGGFIICWKSYGQDDSYWGIYGRIYKDDGSEQGEEFRVNTYTTGDQRNPCISSLNDGGFIICWESDGQDGSGYGVYGQLYNSDGSTRGDEFRANTTTSHWQYNPRVSSLSDGGFAVCWQSYNQDGSGEGIYGQLYNSDGLKRGSEFQINTTTENNQVLPDISGLGNGGFVAVWESRKEDGANIDGLYGQLFKGDGSKLGAELRFKKTNYPREPIVSSLSDGKFVVCWSDWDLVLNNNKIEIYAQLFNNDGSVLSPKFRVNSHTDNHQDYPAVSSLNDGRIIVAWQSHYQDGLGIFAKYYLPEPLNHPLQSYTLLEPGVDIIINTFDTNLKWTAASSLHYNFPWELEYKLYLDELDDFNNPQIIPAIYDTSYTLENLIPGKTYFWKVLVKNIAGDSLWSSETFGFFVDWNATALEEISVRQPQEFELQQNYPNPFNPTTNISYSVRSNPVLPLHLELAIYNLQGKKVTTLVDKQQSPGEYSVAFDASDLPSGVYMYHLKAGTFVQTRKMILLR